MVFQKGHKINLGRKREFTEEHKRNMRKPKSNTKNMRKIKKGEHISPNTEFKKGHKQSPEICAKKANKGAKNPNWKGGITPINNLLRHTKEYYKWRTLVFERDNFTCQECKKRGGNLEPHHIKSFADYPKLRLEVSNGITLCIPCHKNV